MRRHKKLVVLWQLSETSNLQLLNRCRLQRLSRSTGRTKFGRVMKLGKATLAKETAVLKYLVLIPDQMEDIAVDSRPATLWPSQ